MDGFFLTPQAEAWGYMLLQLRCETHLEAERLGAMPLKS
jgi:hypothetical protein